ncbi:MAG: type II toxin-antitoxin system VapB family antitoxin [Bryobacteraceae bacterium]
MRTTLNLDDDLLRAARESTGIQEKTALIHRALRELVARKATRRLEALGGAMPAFQAGRRRRSQKVTLPPTSGARWA